MLILCASSSNIKAKSLFTLWKLGSANWFKFGFGANNSGFDRYLFQLVVLLKPGFNCYNNFAYLELIKSLQEHKVLFLVIANVAPGFAASV